MEIIPFLINLRSWESFMDLSSRLVLQDRLSFGWLFGLRKSVELREMTFSGPYKLDLMSCGKKQFADEFLDKTYFGEISKYLTCWKKIGEHIPISHIRRCTRSTIARSQGLMFTVHQNISKSARPRAATGNKVHYYRKLPRNTKSSATDQSLTPTKSVPSHPQRSWDVVQL